MISFGLLGVGKFGSRVRRVLQDESIIDLHWVADSRSVAAELSSVDWVYICSSSECHYENALVFIMKGSNIILEKPPTLNVIALKNLVDKASEYNVKIYFSMVYLFDNQAAGIKSPSRFNWQKCITTPSDDSSFTAFLFHHLYIFLRNMHSDDIDKLKPKKIHFSSPDDFSFELWGSQKLADFRYLRSVSSPNKHSIDDVSIEAGKPDTLAKMLKYVLKTPDLDENTKLALHTLRILASVRSEVFTRKVVVGAGIFGCSTALALGSKGYNVDLIERNSQIMQEASAINQYRVHRGYHYPRSDETVSQCAQSYPTFEKKFSHAMVDRSSHTNSYYAIASHGSKVSPKEYLDFLGRNSLAFQEAEIGLTNISLTLEVEERLYDPLKLKKIVADRLFAMGVNILTDKQADKDTLKKYNGGVIATYANQGYWDKLKVDYQFELCEKPVARLPKRYRGLSIVIMDGPFMCIDPLSDTGFHVLGNVTHAIHKTTYGSRPLIPEAYNHLINKGCVKPPQELTNFKLFVESAAQFLPEIIDAEHIGSMYTIRAVECNRDHDDARLSTVNKLDDSVYKIFSGKVCTSVNIASNVTQLISAENNLSVGEKND